MLENIITELNESISNYGEFKDYSVSFSNHSKNEEEPDIKESELADIVYQHPYVYSSFFIPETELSIPDYFSLTEKIRASFQPSYSNYLQDVMNKGIAYLNMPEVSAYGWVIPSDPETPIYINTAYANTQEQVNSTISHEMNHEQTRTYHENPMQHELRVRLDTNTSYLG